MLPYFPEQRRNRNQKMRFNQDCNLTSNPAAFLLSLTVFAGVSASSVWNLIRFLFNIYTSLNVYRHFLSLSSNCSPFFSSLPHNSSLYPLNQAVYNSSPYMLLHAYKEECMPSPSLLTFSRTICMQFSPAASVNQSVYRIFTEIQNSLDAILFVCLFVFPSIYKSSVFYQSVWPSLQPFYLPLSSDCPHILLVL